MSPTQQEVVLNACLTSRPRLRLVASLGLVSFIAAISGCGSTPATSDPNPAAQLDAGPASPQTSADLAPRPIPQTPTSSAPADTQSPSIPAANTNASAFLDSFAKYEGKSLDQWIAQLGDKDDLKRSAAADAVAKYGPNAKSAVPALVGLLKNPDDSSLVTALKAIGKIGPPTGEAVDSLIPLLSHPKAEVRGLAAETLGEMGEPAGKAVRRLTIALEAAKDGTELERVAIRHSILKLGKYNIRAVFAAQQAGELSHSDLNAVIDCLGPGDIQAIDGLTRIFHGF